MLRFDADFAAKHYRGAIFDLDGTLINSMPLHVRAWELAAAERGFSVDPQYIYDLGGTSSLRIAELLHDQGLYVGEPRELFNRKVALYREHLDEIKTFPAIEALLRRLHELGMKIAIGTGTQRINADDILRNLGLEPLIAAVVTSDEVKNFKPHPETFLMAAQLLDLRPAQCLVFDDGALGIQAARCGGFDAVEVREDKLTAAHFLLDF